MDTDTIQGNQTAPEEPSAEIQQPEPMPSSNQTTTEEQQIQPANEGDEFVLPEGVAERTRQQFEKLKGRLAAAEAKQKEPRTDYGSSVFDSFHAPQPQPAQAQAQDAGYLNQAQVNAIYNQYIDAEGNVDLNGFNQAITQASDYARQALQRAQAAEDRLARFEESQQAKEAHTVFPQLDPMQENFDERFFKYVRAAMLDDMASGKSKRSLLAVASDVAKDIGVNTPPVNVAKVKEEAVAQYKAAQANRNQGPIEQGKGESRQTTATLDELRERTRKGDNNAILERLKGVGIIE